MTAIKGRMGMGTREAQRRAHPRMKIGQKKRLIGGIGGKGGR